MSEKRRSEAEGKSESDAVEPVGEAADQRKRGPSLTRQVGALASGSVAAQAFALLLLMGLTRLVPKAELGAYQQLGLIYGIVSPLLVAGIPAALLYFIPRSDDPADASARTGEAYVVLGALGIITSVVVAVGRGPLAEALGNPELSGALLLYAPYPFFAFVTGVMPTALVAVGRAGLAAVLNALGGVLIAIGVLAAALIKADAPHMASGLVAGQVCIMLDATFAVQRTIGIAVHPAKLKRGALALLRYGLPLALTGLAGKFAFQFDRLVVSHNFTPALFAVYVVGAVELPITAIVQQAVNAVLVPALSRHYAAGDLAGLAALWRRAIRRTSLILFPFFVYFMLTSTATVRFLFGGSYAESADVFRVYLLLVPLRVATYGLITQAIGRTHINLTASFVLLAMNAVLVLTLIGPLGLVGAALGTVLATFGTSLYYLFRLRRILRMSIRALFPWRMLAINLALTVLAGVPAALVVLAGLDGVLQLALAALLFGPAYVALMMLTRRLDAQEIVWGRRLLATVLGIRPHRRQPPPTDGSG
jgi:O-antigen/teichoic acid export membrane protein